MEDSYQSFEHVEVERTELANVSMRRKRLGLPQTTVRGSLQITLCCGEGKPSLWLDIPEMLTPVTGILTPLLDFGSAKLIA